MDEVSFYIPRGRMPPPEVARAWKRGKPLQLKAGGPAATEQAWVYQTYVRLRAQGVSCRLVHEVPEQGVLVAFVSSFDKVPTSLRGDVFFVCVVADAIFHPFANWYVVQNPRQARRVRNSTFLPHWPQPALWPRAPGRGDAFENVCYYGNRSNLAPALRSAQWRRRLHRETGLRFRMPGPEAWHDYRETDAVVAVRSFEAGRPFSHKPATKLYNAWLAGVPALCGVESAFRAERRTERDYLEARSPKALIRQLRFLKERPDVARAMRANAARRGRAHTPEAVAEAWRQFLEGVAQPRALRWRRAGAVRQKEYYLRQEAHWLWKKVKAKGRRTAAVLADSLFPTTDPSE